MTAAAITSILSIVLGALGRTIKSASEARKAAADELRKLADEVERGELVPDDLLELAIEDAHNLSDAYARRRS